MTWPRNPNTGLDKNKKSLLWVILIPVPEYFEIFTCPTKLKKNKKTTLGNKFGTNRSMNGNENAHLYQPKLL